METKECRVRVHYQTYVDVNVTVDADATENEIKEKARIVAVGNRECIDNMLSHCVEVSEMTEIISSLSTKESLYSDIYDIVEEHGGFLSIKTAKRRVFIEEGETTKCVVFKALFIGNALKAVDTNDDVWDVDDYLNANQLFVLLAQIKN